MLGAAGADCEHSSRFSPLFVHECSHVSVWRWGIGIRSLTQVFGGALASSLSWESREIPHTTSVTCRTETSQK